MDARVQRCRNPGSRVMGSARALPRRLNRSGAPGLMSPTDIPVGELMNQWLTAWIAWYTTLMMSTGLTLRGPRLNRGRSRPPARHNGAPPMNSILSAFLRGRHHVLEALVT